MRDGTLPSLARLRSRGLWGTTRGIEGFFVGSTWPSLYTSTTPARHGFHYQYQIRTGTYALREMTGGSLVRQTAFWEHLSAAGKRVCMLDVPLAQPYPGINGIQMLEWGAHDAMYGFQATPADLGEQVLSRFGRHPVGSHCDAERKSPEDYRRFRDQLLAGIDARTRLTLDMLAREPWDFLMQVFSETHCVGHQCWHLHDESHPSFERSPGRQAGDPVKEVYQAVDRAIGKVVEACGDAVVLVFSSHGMSYWYGADFLLRPILVRLGVAVDWPAAPENAAGNHPLEWLRPIWRHLGDTPRRFIRRVLDRMSPPARPGAAIPRLAVDPMASHCFPMKNGMAHSGIRLNLAGREPAGLIQRGEDEERFVADLTRDLLAILDERTGKPLIRRVLRTRDVCSGPLLDDLPDLLVEWSDDVATGCTTVSGGAGSEVTISSPKLGRLAARNEFGRTGEHRPDGMFIGANDLLPAQHIFRAVSTLDLAPTFCALLNVSMPGAEGSPITEMVSGLESRAREV